jgi:hypothetical protein
MMVYLAADRPLPLVPPESNPALHIRQLSNPEDAVRQQFTKPHVYYAGSWEGCGCGFNYGEWPEEATVLPARYADCKRSRDALADYLRQALTIVPELELIACWAGRQARRPRHTSQATPDQIADGRTYFLEGEFLTITNPSK